MTTGNSPAAPGAFHERALLNGFNGGLDAPGEGCTRLPAMRCRAFEAFTALRRSQSRHGGFTANA